MKKILLILALCALSFQACLAAPSNNQVTVTSSAAAIVTPITPTLNQVGWLIRNTDASNSIYIGFNSNVSSSTGYLLKAGEAISLPAQQIIYGIAASSSVVICYISVTTN